MAAEGGAIVTFIFNGEDSEDIPLDVTHLIIHESITVIPAQLLSGHPNLVEVYCHAGVIKIERNSFFRCRSLRRVIIPGVIIIEAFAFDGCTNLVHVECDKLERIGFAALKTCKSLSCINLPSAKFLEGSAFRNCPAMTQVIFGKDLEFFGGGTFDNCRSLESITIPLKNGLFIEDNTFKRCVNLKRVNLVEDEFLGDFTDALLLESWRNDLNEVLDSMNEILPNTAPGDDYNYGGKVIAIRGWIESVLRKVTHYKAAHRDLLNEAAIALQSSLPNDAVINNVLPFIGLPSNTAFDGEDEG